MSVRIVSASLAVAVLVLLSAWLFRWPLDEAAVLAPVIVVVAAVTAGLFVLWIRIGVDQLRESRHPRLIVGLALAFVALLVGLTLLGVKLPRE